jgi:CDP-6-deoxy-D-xylo-4-hexulose-3-dehydrase
LKYLDKNKIGTRLLFSGNLTKQPYMKEIKYKIHGNLKNTDFVMENTFWIGVYPGLSKYHLGYAIEKLKIFFK